MARARTLEVAALQGLHLHDGFLGEETLLRLIQHDNYKEAVESLRNERLRAFRSNYQEFARSSERLQRKQQAESLQLLITSWITATVRYLGYSDFESQTAKHWEDGEISYLSPKSDTHSVAVFISSTPLALTATVHDTFPLTSISGEVLSSSSRKESLCEQVEKAINQVGVAEALLLTPNAAYYFRADSQITGQCLEIRWDEMLIGDNDSALVLATYLLRSEFYSFVEQTPAAQLEAEIAETEVGDEDEAESSGLASKVTQSSGLFKENLDQAREITEDLHKQVVLALEILVNERLAVDSALKKESLKPLANEIVAHDLFKDGLFVLYRILFVLYAESRGLLPVNNRRFSSFYSLEHLRDWSEEYLKRRNRGLAKEDGTYIWSALGCIFTLLRRGVSLPGGEQVSPYNGQLFAPDRSPYFDGGPPLRDDAMALVMTALTRVGGASSARRLHFANLGVEQLGAVYEALLAQKPMIISEESLWVPAHGEVVGLTSKRLARTLEMRTFDDEANQQAGRNARRNQQPKLLEKFIDSRRPAFAPTIGKFVVAPLGGQKRQTASFYTPPKLAEFLVRRTLRPLAEGKSSKQILSLKIVEPAMGSGGFLIQVVRYLASELLKAKIREKSLELRTGEKPTFTDRQRCKREVVESCIFGVDINPLAIELARTSLYLEALVPGEPLPFLHHRLKSGNSLIGSDLQNRSQSSWVEGVVFPALFDIPIDHIKIDEKLWGVWDGAHKQTNPSSKLKTDFEATKKKLKIERNQIGAERWAAWANEMQLKVSEMLQLARQAQEDFEAVQASNEIVDELDGRYKDHLAFIPDMDPVLIEANDVVVDPRFLSQRKSALLNEFGPKRYKILVERQRAYTRLKALGDLHAALWYWPLNRFSSYPSFAQYRDLVSWLLNSDALSPDAKALHLPSQLMGVLKTALFASRQHRTLNWQVEFATVFADPNRSGFDAVISNPPWKSIGIVDKDIFPHFDPQFLDTDPSKKSSRIKKIIASCPEVPALLVDRTFALNRMAEHWRSGALSDVKPKGQLDYCIAFSLLPSRLLRSQGRVGLIVSRPAIFVSKNALSVREFLFREGGLQEAFSFVNRSLIFDIAPHMEFSLLISQRNASAVSSANAPKFISGLADPNVLNIVERIVDYPDAGAMLPGVFPVNLTENDIRLCFSPKNLVVPQLRDQREIDIAKALVAASGPTTKLDKIKVYLKRGIDHSSGPSNAQYTFSEDMSVSRKPQIQKILNGDQPDWVPLCRGRDFNLFDPLVDIEGTSGELHVNEYVKRTTVGDYFDLKKATFVWRATGGKNTNKRSPICTLLPPGLWSDHNVWGCQFDTIDEALALLCLFGSLALDFYTGLISFSNVSKGVALALPIPTYRSPALSEAIEIAKGLLGKIISKASYWEPIARVPAIRGEYSREIAQAKIDALIWLHYGMNKGALDRSHLQWVLENHFPILNKTNPNYKQAVLDAYDEYSQIAKFCTRAPGEVFGRVQEVRSIVSSGDRGAKTEQSLPKGKRGQTGQRRV